MCGIAGIYFNEPRRPGITRKERETLIDQLLLGIEHRGRHASGIVAAKGTSAQLFKRDMPAKQFVKLRPRIQSGVDTVLLHTRFATQGDPSNPLNNHPVTCGSVFAVHNGHVSNDGTLFAQHGLTRKAEVDTEIIPQLFNKVGLEKAHIALQQLEGNVATAVIDPKRHPHTLVLAKGVGSPCAVWKNEYGFIFASEARVIQDAVKTVFGREIPWKEIDYLTEGDLWYVENGKIEELEFKVKKREYVRSYTSGYTPSTASTTSQPQKVEEVWDRTGRRTQPTDGPDYIKKRLSSACATCNCTKFWHYGPEYDGMCLKRDCQCRVFVEAVPQASKDVTPDPLKRKTFTIFDTQQNRRITYIACKGCQHAFEMDEITTFGGYDWCAECWGTDGFVPGGEAIDKPSTPAQEEVLQTAAEQENETVSLTELVEQQREILEAIAEEHDTTPYLVAWILFEASDQLFKNQPTLADMYDLFLESYIEREGVIEEGGESCAVSAPNACGVTVFETEDLTEDAETV